MSLVSKLETSRATRIPFGPSADIPETDVQRAIEAVLAAAAADLAAHLGDATAAHAASAISFAPVGSIAATDVQAALAELDDDSTAVAAAFAAHLADASDAHDASAISYGGATGVSATDVEGALDELAAEKLNTADLLAAIQAIDGAGSGIDADLLDGQSSAFYATAQSVTDHITDPTAAHAASAISFTPAGGVSATDVQGAIAQLAGAAGIPIGTVVDYAGASAPSLWMLCYGQAVSRATYAALFAVIGTTYGAGDGSTTFNLPDLRGRVVAGQDDMGGTSANRLTNQSGGLDGDMLGAAGGAETHTLSTAQMPVHNHGVNDPGHAHSYSVPASAANAFTSGGSTSFWTAATSAATTGASSTGISIQNAGSGGAHNNVQPTFILYKIIFAGA